MISSWLANKKIPFNEKLELHTPGEVNQEGLESNQFLGAVCCQVGSKHICSSILEPCFLPKTDIVHICGGMLKWEADGDRSIFSTLCFENLGKLQQILYLQLAYSIFIYWNTVCWNFDWSHIHFSNFRWQQLPEKRISCCQGLGLLEFQIYQVCREPDAGAAQVGFCETPSSQVGRISS